MSNDRSPYRVQRDASLKSPVTSLPKHRVIAKYFESFPSRVTQSRSRVVSTLRNDSSAIHSTFPLPYVFKIQSLLGLLSFLVYTDYIYFRMRSPKHRVLRKAPSCNKYYVFGLFSSQYIIRGRRVLLFSYFA